MFVVCFVFFIEIVVLSIVFSGVIGMVDMFVYCVVVFLV